MLFHLALVIDITPLQLIKFESKLALVIPSHIYLSYFHSDLAKWDTPVLPISLLSKSVTRIHNPKHSRPLIYVLLRYRHPLLPMLLPSN